jgi:hypothetical protein
MIVTTNERTNLILERGPWNKKFLPPTYVTHHWIFIFIVSITTTTTIIIIDHIL